MIAHITTIKKGLRIKYESISRSPTKPILKAVARAFV
jgi:hypothetical protein